MSASNDPNSTEPDNVWSRRRAAVKAEAEAEVKAVEDAQLAEDLAELEEKTDAQILEELDLPDPDTMEAGADFSRFMKAAVPDRLRRRALRKLWLTNPMLANLDELLDYGDDFTDSAMIIENMQTAYQVGKGMLKHVEAMARQAEEAEGSSATLSEDMPEEVPCVEGEDQEPGQNNTDQDYTEDDQVTQDETELETSSEMMTENDMVIVADDLPFDTDKLQPAPIRRRMRFSFDG